jgi:class 3 adenylate cyclase
MVSIIFTDFKGFTETSGNLSAGELVGELNYCFKGFDAIIEKYSIEKIKTIGDAYMAAKKMQLSVPFGRTGNA